MKAKADFTVRIELDGELREILEELLSEVRSLRRQTEDTEDAIRSTSHGPLPPPPLEDYPLR